MMAAVNVNMAKATWYYKDKHGMKQGPSMLDTLKIMWDFNEVDETTHVFADGMMDYAPIRDVPPLFKVGRPHEPGVGAPLFEHGH